MIEEYLTSDAARARAIEAEAAAVARTQARIEAEAAAAAASALEADKREFSGMVQDPDLGEYIVEIEGKLNSGAADELQDEELPKLSTDLTMNTSGEIYEKVMSLIKLYKRIKNLDPEFRIQYVTTPDRARPWWSNPP